MPTAMEIPVSVPGIGDAVKQLGAMARAVKGVASAEGEWKKAERELQRDRERGGAAPMKALADAQRRSAPRRLAQLTAERDRQKAVVQAQSELAEPQQRLDRILSRGPIARIQRIQAAQVVARTPEQREDLGIMLAQAQRRLLLLQRRGAGAGGIGGRISEALLSSRVGAGGGGFTAMPLVSRIVDVLESIPGPVGLVTKAMILLTGAAIAAEKNIRELASASVQSGGTIREVATLRGLGLDPGQIAGRAAALRERLLSDPNAVGAANRLGLPAQMPIIAGGQNNARILLQAADAIRKLTSAEDRLREARLLGEESLVELARVSDYVYAGIKANAAATAVIVDQAAQQAQADLSAGWGQFVDSIKLLATSLGTPIIQDLAPILNLAAYLITGVALAIKVLVDVFHTLIPSLNGLSENPLLKWLLEKLGGGGSSADQEHDDAMRNHADALNKNSQVLQQGTYGGGERLRGALPGADTGELLRRGMEGNAIRMGAFGLG